MREDRGRHRIGLEIRVAVLLELVRQVDDLEAHAGDRDRGVDRRAARGIHLHAGALGLEVGHERARVPVDEIGGTAAQRCRPVQCIFGSRPLA